MRTTILVLGGFAVFARAADFPVEKWTPATPRKRGTYNNGMKRYLWCHTGAGSDTRFAGGFAIYDAPEPWGPWTTTFHTAKWDVGPGETSSFPSKWISADGLAKHLVFSGDDCFSVREAKLILRQQP